MTDSQRRLQEPLGKRGFPINPVLAKDLAPGWQLKSSLAVYPSRAEASGYGATQNQALQGWWAATLPVLGGWRSPVHHHSPPEPWWELAGWQVSSEGGHNMMGLKWECGSHGQGRDGGAGMGNNEAGVRLQPGG